MTRMLPRQRRDERTFLYEILANLQSEDALSIRERRASEKRGQKMRKRRIEGREREGERERERERDCEGSRETDVLWR